MEDLKTRIDKVIAKIDIASKHSSIAELEADSMDPSFWKDPKAASEKMKEMASLQKEIEQAKQIRDLFDSGKTDEAEKLLEELETLLYFSGVYDKSSALVSIHAGQGGVEAMDWTEMLNRMYRRYGERKGFA